jgi:hypothetical protein
MHKHLAPFLFFFFFFFFFFFCHIRIMQVLSDLQAEHLCGGRRGGAMAGFGSRRGGNGLGRFSGGGGLLAFQSILNTVNQINFAINIAIGGSTIFNNQVNALSIESTI